jgi:hypothetical protein
MRRFSSAILSLTFSSQHQFDSPKHQFHFDGRQFANAFCQVRFIQRHRLRDIRHRILWQSGRSRLQVNVTRHQGPYYIAGKRNANHCGNTAAIESIRLNHKHGPSKPRRRFSRWRQIRPPYLAPRNHHSLRSRTLRPAETANRSSSRFWLPNSAHARLIASVISSGVCRATYSRSASLKIRLRDRFVRLASRSACSNTSSGMETAVFILKV